MTPFLRKFNFKLTLTSLLLTYFLFIVGAFDLLESKSIDSRFKWRGKKETTGKVAIVSIDDDTYDTLRRKFPWSRELYARLLRNLRKAGAKVIVFDLEFDIPNIEDPRGDFQFAKAISEKKDVVLASKLMNVGGKNYHIIPPIPSLLYECASVGLVGIFTDPDGFVRHYPLYFELGAKQHLTLALQALKEYLGKTPEVPKVGPNRFLINYRGPAKTIPTYPFWCVIDDESFTIEETETSMDLDAFNELLKDEVFKDKIVFVGATLAELHDLKLTPFYDWGGKKVMMPGVEVHANACETIIGKDFIHKLDFIWELGLLLIFCTVVPFVTFKERPKLSIPIILVLIGIYVFFTYLMFFTKNIWLPLVAPCAALVLSYGVNTVSHYWSAQKEKRFIKDLFGHYLSKSLVDKLIANPDMVKLGGERKYLTVLFSDVAGFTTVAEKYEPEFLVSFLNEYLSEMTEIIFKYEGMLDKYEGDAIMAVFGAPIPTEAHPKLACLAAIEMQEKLVELREKWKTEGKPELKVRMGINSGFMVIGNMGSGSRMDYTVMGDSVNLASRLEGSNKVYSTDIMISEETYNKAKEYINAREIDLIKVKGKSQPVRVYQLLSKSDEVRFDQEFLENYNRGIELYRYRNWEASLACFKKCSELQVDDILASIYVRRCQHFIENPPPPDWDGVYELKEK